MEVFIFLITLTLFDFLILILHIFLSFSYTRTIQWSFLHHYLKKAIILAAKRSLSHSQEISTNLVTMILWWYIFSSFMSGRNIFYLMCFALRPCIFNVLNIFFTFPFYIMDTDLSIMLLFVITILFWNFLRFENIYVSYWTNKLLKKTFYSTNLLIIFSYFIINIFMFQKKIGSLAQLKCCEKEGNIN